MARYTTGEEIPPHLTSPKLPADHPFFKRGYMIGIRRAADFSAKPQKLEETPPADEVTDQ